MQSFIGKMNLMAIAICTIALAGCGAESSSSDQQGTGTDTTTITDSDNTGGIDQSYDEYATDELPLAGVEDADAKVGFKIVDGKAIAEGDIVLGDYDTLVKAGKVDALQYPLPLSDSPEFDMTEVNQTGDNTQFSAWGGQTKWTNGIVPYSIDTANYYFSNNDIAIIKQAMAELEAVANLKFVPAWNGANQIRFTRRQGCNSPVGMVGGVQDISLEGTCVAKGVVIHELMHALGFWHEQSRADRDDYVTINWQNIQDGLDHAFYIKGASTTSMGPYDFGSIMHYEPYAFSKNGYPTIVAKKSGVTFGQIEKLSSLDIQALQKAYGAPKNTTTNEAPRVRLKYSAVWMWNNTNLNIPFEIYDDNDSNDQLKTSYTLDRQDVINPKAYNFIPDSYNQNLFYIPLEALNPYNEGKNYSRADLTFTFTDTAGAATTVKFSVYVYTYANWPGYSPSAQGLLFKSTLDNQCLTSSENRLGLAECTDTTQGFELSQKGLLTAKSNSELCLTAVNLVKGSVLTLDKCDANNINQKFQYEGHQIVAQQAMHLAVSNQDGIPVLAPKNTNRASTTWNKQ